MALPDDVIQKISISFESYQYTVFFDDSFVYVSLVEKS